MKVELERDNLFFASFCPCFVVMQISKYKNGGYVWVRDIDKHMFTQSHWSLWSKCIWRVSSTFGVYNCYISYRLSLFFDLDFVGELYSHKQQQYNIIPLPFYYCKLTSKFIFLCFEQPGGDTGRHPVSSNRRPQPYQIESRPSEEEERVRENNDVKVSIFILAEYILFKNKALWYEWNSYLICPEK